MKYLSRVAVVALLIGFAMNASAVPITVVGQKDEVIAWATLSNSGEATEEEWMTNELGYEVSNSHKYSDLTWESVTGDGAVEGDYAFYLGDSVEGDYLLKLGGGAGADYTHYVVRNNNNENWAFINLGDFNMSFDLYDGGDGVALTNIGIISHIRVVPEPSTLTLLGAGLLGLGLLRRKKTA